MKKIVGVNEKGLRVGQDHQRAKLSDHAVELMRQLREGGMSYAMLAEKFGVCKRQAWRICNYVQRAQTSTAFRSLP